MSPILSGLISLSETTKNLIDDDGQESLLAPDSVIPLILSHRSQSRPILVVTHSSRRASELAEELSAFSARILEFPAWETLPHERLSPNSDTVAKRISALYQFNDARIIITPIRAFVQPIIASISETPRLSVRVGDTYQFEVFIRSLINRGYSRVDLVERQIGRAHV